MFPTFFTAHCLLREIRPGDIEPIQNGMSDPRFLAQYGVACDVQDVSHLQMTWQHELQEAQEGLWWGIAALGIPEQLTGACGFNDWDRASRCVEQEQPACGQLLDRLGVTHEGSRRECELRAGQFIDLDYYGLLAHEWTP